MLDCAAEGSRIAMSVTSDPMDWLRDNISLACTTDPTLSLNSATEIMAVLEATKSRWNAGKFDANEYAVVNRLQYALMAFISSGDMLVKAARDTRMLRPGSRERVRLTQRNSQ